MDEIASLPSVVRNDRKKVLSILYNVYRE